MFRLGISKGKYPDILINAWDEWDEKEESENDRPGNVMIDLLTSLSLDVFTHDQLYVMFAFENSGSALEAFTVMLFTYNFN